MRARARGRGRERLIQHIVVLSSSSPSLQTAIKADLAVSSFSRLFWLTQAGESESQSQSRRASSKGKGDGCCSPSLSLSLSRMYLASWNICLGGCRLPTDIRHSFKTAPTVSFRQTEQQRQKDSRWRLLGLISYN